MYVIYGDGSYDILIDPFKATQKDLGKWIEKKYIVYSKKPITRFNAYLINYYAKSSAYYDDIRIREALLRLSQRGQVLIFTCHKREQTLLKEMRLPYHFVDLSVNEMGQ